MSIFWTLSPKRNWIFHSLISCCIIVKELITHTHSLHKLSMSHPFIFFIMEKLFLAKARFFVMQENFSFLVKCIYEWPQDPLYCNLILQQLSRLIPTHKTMHILYVGLKDDLLLQNIAHWEISGIFQSYPYILTYLFDSFLEFWHKIV